jgi:serine/threonine-protein kinase RsbW/stage II sporulation protein AB (anti-sigma F factor)
LASVPQPGSCLPESQVELDLIAAPEHVSVARRAIAQVAESANLDAGQRSSVALAVSEACSNVVVHAYAGTTPGELNVRAQADDGRLTVVVGDRGKGMCPRSDSPGIGLGLPLMASLCSTLEVRERPGGGTEICMVFESAAVTADANWLRAG